MNEEKVFQLLNNTLKTDSTKAVKNALKGIVPERWLLFLFDRAAIDLAETGAHMPAEKIRTLAKLLKAFQ